MRARGTQSLTDGELNFIIENGIRLTGMPAWGQARDDDLDSWKLVTFIHHVPSLTTHDEPEMERLNLKEPNRRNPVAAPIRVPAPTATGLLIATLPGVEGRSVGHVPFVSVLQALAAYVDDVEAFLQSVATTQRGAMPRRISLPEGGGIIVSGGVRGESHLQPAHAASGISLVSLSENRARAMSRVRSEYRIATRPTERRSRAE